MGWLGECSGQLAHIVGRGKNNQGEREREREHCTRSRAALTGR